MKTIGILGFGRTGSEHRDHRLYFRGIGVTNDKGVGDVIINCCDAPSHSCDTVAWRSITARASWTPIWSSTRGSDWAQVSSGTLPVVNHRPLGGVMTAARSLEAYAAFVQQEGY